ncbi:hypothetical protein [Pyrobaculum aerophilum]|uniref:Uncharacterized protein n=1 Tax=Pyrobaculum aerophilum TaxID=13773 RepID=A0A371R5W8_9CREN|nr:hypothetical protein [Pyrobaculum aerophilum]RFA94161.1 hypothetical protein CGL51_11110 [Pyrobaculum aerophilum]RFA99419.1 hypothetical protein CGL52_03395 [Pyrobaculum aerophilum]
MRKIILIYRDSPVEGEVAPGVYITPTVGKDIKNNVVLVVEDRELAQKLNVGYLSIKEAEAFIKFVQDKYFEEDSWYVHSIQLDSIGREFRLFKKFADVFLGGEKVAVVKDPTLDKNLGFETELLLAPWYVFERRICGVKEAVRLAKRLAEDLLDHISNASAVLFIMAHRIAPISRCSTDGSDIQNVFWSSLATHITHNKKIPIYLVYDKTSKIK